MFQDLGKMAGKCLAMTKRWSRAAAAAFMVAAGCAGASAQSLRCDEGTFHLEGVITAGLNNDGYEANFGVVYFPVQYVGFKAAIGFAGELTRMEDWDLSWGDDDRDDYWDDDDDNDYTVRFKFNPAIVLRSPQLINLKSQNGGIYLFAEPGFVLSPGARGSHKAEWIRWDLKGGVNLQLDRLVLSIGYGVSNFSLYSGRPFNENGLPDDDNYITHNGFIGCAYKF